MFLRLGLNQDLLPLNMKREILLDTSKNAMALLQGATGSGKTFLLNRMFAYCEYDLEQSGDDATVILCDFKGDDSFKEYRECKGYYAFMECIEGIERFWSIFKDRQQGNPDRSFVLLCFDEYASFLTALDKKEQEAVKKKIAVCVMMARSFGMAIIFVCQMGYADTFDKIRNNITCVIAMSNVSKEMEQMFFYNVKEDMRNDKSRGTGHVLVDGSTLRHIVVPKINDIGMMNCFVKKLLNREGYQR